MAREGAMASVTYSFACLAVLASLAAPAADGSALPKPEKRFGGMEREVTQQLNTSALNTALAFEPYHDLATSTAAAPGVQQPRQSNILFSPLGLASALALLSRVSGSESRIQALEALGLGANSTERSVEATISALTELQHRLALQEGGGGGGGVQRAESEAGAGPEAGTGAAAGAEPGDAGNRADVDDAAENKTEDQLRMWSDLHINGKPSLDYDGFLSRPRHTGPSAANTSFKTLMKDLEGSDKLELNNFVYFKGRQPFERRHTVPRSFQLNATASVEVAMMFRDDSSEAMMLYDTNCSATVVRLAQSERLASLLLLPKAELQPLEDCLSHSRMSFWLSNLKPGSEFTKRGFKKKPGGTVWKNTVIVKLERQNYNERRAEILFPKFQLRKSYSVEGLLRTAGVSSLFSDSADFSAISPKKTLKLVKALHEVKLEVEETKSEDGGRPDIMLDFSVPPRITFNRPFVFIIYDDVTGLVLLIGRMMDPTDV